MSMPVCAQFFNLESLRANGIVSATINDIFLQSRNNKVFNVNASHIPLEYLKSNIKKMIFGKRYVLFGDEYGDILLSNTGNNYMQSPGFGLGAVQGFGMTDKTVVQALNRNS